MVTYPFTEEYFTYSQFTVSALEGNIGWMMVLGNTVLAMLCPLEFMIDRAFADDYHTIDHHISIVVILLALPLARHCRSLYDIAGPTHRVVADNRAIPA